MPAVAVRVPDDREDSQCACGELVRDYGDGWVHLSDGQPCPPAGEGP